MVDLTLQIRGLINDLTRTLTAAAVYLDDLQCELDGDCDKRDYAYLADLQLGRALEFFFEMKSLYSIFLKHYSIEKSKGMSHEISVIDKITHKFNNILTVIMGYCDLMLTEEASSLTKDMVSIILETTKKANLLLTEITVLNSLTGQNARLTYDGKGPKFGQKRRMAKNKNRSTSFYLLKNGKILLVEDEEEVRNVIALSLLKRGYTVIGCDLGVKALDMVKNEGDIRLALIDVELPDMLGTELFQQIVTINPDIEVLFISGHCNALLQDPFQKCEFPLIRKPFRIHELCSAILRLCKKPLGEGARGRGPLAPSPKPSPPTP